MTVTNTSPVETLQSWLVDKLAEQLSLDTDSINITESLTRYGLDSIDAVTMVGDLEDWLDLELPSTLFWDHPSIEKASEYLAENFDLSGAINEVETDSKIEEKQVENKPKGGLFARLMGK